MRMRLSPGPSSARADVSAVSPLSFRATHWPRLLGLIAWSMTVGLAGVGSAWAQGSVVISRAEVQPTEASAGEPVKVTTAVRNTSQVPLSGLVLVLRDQGKETARQPLIRLDGGAETVVVFGARVPALAEKACFEVALRAEPGGKVALGPARPVCVAIRAKLAGPLAPGVPGPTAAANAATPGLGAPPAAIRAETLTPESFRALPDSAVIVVKGQQLTKAQVRARAEQVKQGADARWASASSDVASAVAAAQAEMEKRRTAELAAQNAAVQQEVARLGQGAAGFPAPSAELDGIRREAEELRAKSKDATPAQQAELEKRAGELLLRMQQLKP